MTALENPEPTSGHSTPSTSRFEVCRRLLQEIDAVDHATFNAVAGTPTPTLDGPMTFISNAANYSGLWFLNAGVLAVVGGRSGRRAAVRGLAAIGVASAVANLAAKQLFPRSRPSRLHAIRTRQAAMPASGSFPSGHTASAFAFAAAAATELPVLSLPLYGGATVVGYSRVHNGVHYPSDVIGGAVLGLAVGTVVGAATRRRGRRPRRG